MKRGIFALLSVLAATFVSPAVAAPPSGVVYEVVRRPSAATRARVEVHNLAGDEPTTTLSVLLEPLPKGGYAVRGSGASWSNAGWSTWGAHEVQLAGGRRFVAGGIRGRVRVVVKEPGWSVREIGSGFRSVATAGQVDMAVAGSPVARHGRVAAAGGAYGSLAWGLVPCAFGAGTWSLGTEAEAREQYSCTPFVDEQGSEFGTTARGRRWTLEGEYAGLSAADYELAVLDFPRPAAR